MIRFAALLFCLFAGNLAAQTTLGKTTIGGSLVTVMLDKNGDTIYVADDLMTVSLTSPRNFKSQDYYNRYRK